MRISRRTVTPFELSPVSVSKRVEPIDGREYLERVHPK